MIVYYIYSRVQIQCLRFVYDTLQYNTIGFFVVVVILSLPRTLNLLLLQISSTLPLPKFIQKLAAATVMHLCIFFCQSQYQNIRRTNAQAKLGLQSRALVLDRRVPARRVRVCFQSLPRCLIVLTIQWTVCTSNPFCPKFLSAWRQLCSIRYAAEQTVTLTHPSNAAIPQHSHNRTYARCVFVCISNFKLCRLML